MMMMMMVVVVVVVEEVRWTNGGLFLFKKSIMRNRTGLKYCCYRESKILYGRTGFQGFK